MTRIVSIVSGYFNPLHVGHLRMMRAARQIGDMLVVIVNNDDQQMLKKGRIILPVADRLEVVAALRDVDRAIVATDTDSTVNETLALLRRDYPTEHLVFANGGDRSSSLEIAEAGTCRSLDIEVRFGIGGNEKADSSSRINAMLDNR